MICRESVILLGRRREVTTDPSGRPQVTLSLKELLENALWRRLPDEGSIWLASRQFVEIVVIDDTGDFNPAYWSEQMALRETSLPALKQQIAERLNDERFERWQQPEIPLPDPYDLDASIPPVEEHVYGQCVLTGQPLIAFGVVGVTHVPGSDWEQRLTSRWTPFRAAAESLRAEAVAALEASREELRQHCQDPGELQAL